MSEETSSKILYDRIIEVRLIAQRYDRGEYDKTAGGYDAELNEYDIIIPANEHGGMKPNISFSASLLPEEMFHEVTLTVRNYKMPFDIRSYKKMEIIAGYRKQEQGGNQYDETIIRRFPIDIFYSYCTTPAPDSITVFKGIIVNSFTNTMTDYFTKNYTYEMIFYKNVSVIEFINSCVRLINSKGYSIALEEEIQPSIKEIIMNTGPSDAMEKNGKRWTFHSVPAILQCISSMLEAACRDSGIQGSYNTTFADGKLIIYCTDGFYSKDEVVVNLDSISSATLNAGILNVTAPWYPPLIPGGIIHVERTYIDGSDLPNVIDVDALMGVDNLYRVLTMDVDFSSVESTNSMKITAIPLRYVEDSNWSSQKGKEEYASKFEVMKDEAEKLIEQVKENSAEEARSKITGVPSKTIVIGEDGEDETRVNLDEKKVEKEDSVNTDASEIIIIGKVPELANPVFNYVKNHPNMFNSYDVRTTVPMEYDTMTADLCETRLYSEGLSLVNPIPDYTHFIKSFGVRWLWPVVYAATYKAYLDHLELIHLMLLENLEVRYEKQFELSENTPTVILAGRCAAYPILDSWDALKNNDMSGLYLAASQIPTIDKAISLSLYEISQILKP